MSGNLPVAPRLPQLCTAHQELPIDARARPPQETISSKVTDAPSSRRLVWLSTPSPIPRAVKAAPATAPEEVRVVCRVLSDTL
ncbi:hypothetical protein CHLRE_16g661626v5 [Chlamydomonas reinhardtii]|uniref:Uncharacterized protein n=1 Tax=Chlamydomonas reinhardtii TaxID=3055 RepID=A0A2K3CTL1_CHLRE|nr:uncharacterized protein CHLRE_16g661626v5 [Chlamydomonas reinhardtii]PNW71613.1 hypothetical protein CHLRE_16g661626v5 [Chlamydomonas reinhardtii]